MLLNSSYFWLNGQIESKFIIRKTKVILYKTTNPAGAYVWFWDLGLYYSYATSLKEEFSGESKAQVRQVKEADTVKTINVGRLWWSSYLVSVSTEEVSKWLLEKDV